MLELLEIDDGHAEEAYRLISGMPEEENGFRNTDRDVSFEEFRSRVIPRMRANGRGEGLPDGYVPSTTYILYEDGVAVGRFHMRHFLNEALRQGGGHIGYGIGPSFRGRGLATAGLSLAIEKARAIVPEKELYLSCWKSNPASLRVMLKNGAYIHHEDEKEYYTRIPL